jgi:hypothetical protein
MKAESVTLTARVCNFKSVSSLLSQPVVFIVSELSHARAEHQSWCGARVCRQDCRSAFRDIKGAKAVGHAPLSARVRDSIENDQAFD